MFHELTPDQFAHVRPLFAGFDYSLSLQAAIDGASPGRIFVDDPHHPRAGLALTVEGYLLAGEHDDPAILDALRQFLRDSIFTGQVYVNGDDSLSLAVDPGAWEARLPELIPTEVVSHCNADCAAGGQVDVGVYTDPAHRRRGLAAAAAAATVEWARQQPAFALLHGRPEWERLLARMDRPAGG